MSAADRMVVRTPDGAYRSVPRRQGLGMISAGRAVAAREPEPVQELAGPPADVETRNEDVDALLSEALAADTPHHEGGLEYVSDVPDPDVPTVEAVAFPPEPRGNASRKDWAEYAESLGVDVTDDMTRNQIRDAAQDVAQTLDRLPQPAREGGRLETPEDEPVTEGSVTDDEDPGTR